MGLGKHDTGRWARLTNSPSPNRAYLTGWNEPMGELHHECGVAAVYHAAGAAVSSLAPIAGDVNSVARLVPRMLLDMQNRGQLAAGMSSFRPDRSALHQDPQGSGHGRRSVSPQSSRGIRGDHGRRSTARSRSATFATQPAAATIEAMRSRSSETTAARPSGLPSPSTVSSPTTTSSKDELLAKGDYHLKRNTDTEIIMHSLAYELQAEDQDPDWVGVFGRIAERFDGAYNIVLITAHGELVVVRDPLGFRPLCIAEHGPLFGAASESVPLANLGFRNIRSLEPGTLAVAGPTESASSGSLPRRASLIASSNGSTSPTSPAPWTIARST